MNPSRQSPLAELPADGPVLMVSSSFPRRPGDSAGHFVGRLAAGLADAGLAVEVLAPHERGLRRQERLGAVPVRRLRYFIPAALQRLAYGSGIPANLRHHPLAWLELPFFLLVFAIAIVRRGRGSRLIHAHWGVLGALAVATRRLHRSPVVVTVHGSDLHPGVRPPAVGGVTRFAIRRANVVLTPSEDFRRRCLELGASDCRFVPHGVDGPQHGELDRVRAARRERLGHRAAPRLIAVGRLVPERRHALLLEALAGIDLDRRGELVLVGDGPERKRLEDLAGRLGPSWTVRFAGAVPTGAVGELLAEADLYVSATAVETFGLATLEAAAWELPIVTTTVGYPAELLGREAARLVEPDDTAGMRAAIEGLLADAAARSRLGHDARRRLEEAGLSWDTAVEATLEAYRSAVEESLR
ncbi:MAG: glycosyltransferase family 4 protein [Thermoanaerobaculia bacterium]